MAVFRAFQEPRDEPPPGTPKHPQKTPIRDAPQTATEHHETDETHPSHNSPPLNREPRASQRIEKTPSNAHGNEVARMRARHCDKIRQSVAR